jgi:hypothetical protein
MSAIAVGAAQLGPIGHRRRGRGARKQRAQLGPHDARRDHLGAGERPEAAVGGGDDPLAGAHGLDHPHDAIGHDLRVLDVVGGRVDHPGEDQHGVRRRYPLEDLDLVLVARVGQGQRQSAHPGAVEQRQHRLQRDVVGVRPVVIAPAEVQPHLLGWDRGDRPVDGVDVHLDHGQEPVERRSPEEPRALHRQVGTVQLEHEAARVDQLVLLLHLAGQRGDVALVRVVVGVEEDRRGRPGRDGRHERLGELLGQRGRAACEQVALPGGLAEVGVLDLGDRLRGVGDPRGRPAPEREHLGVVGVLDQVAGQRTPALAAEPAHPTRDVGREPSPRLLAVVADVHAGVELTLDHVPHGRLGLAGQLGGVDRLAGVLSHQQFAQGGVAGNAADVGRQDALVTASHVNAPFPPGAGGTSRSPAPGSGSRVP